MATSSKRRKNLRTIFGVIAVIVSLVLGAAAGAAVEHKRLKNKSNAQSAAQAASTTTAPIATIDWFGSNATSACAELNKWYGAAGKSAYAMRRHVPWATTRASLLEQTTISQSSLRSLIPLANAAGKVELAFLAASQDRTAPLLSGAASQAAFLTSQKAAGSARVRYDAGVVLRAATSCRT